MLQRKVIQQLEYWKGQEKKLALLLNGTRQTGKTTSVRLFAKKNYQHFVEVNFLKHPGAKSAFEDVLDTRTITLNLSAMGFGPFVEGNTLVFFDEIQECPKARTSIKFLVEEAKYDYVESGSLLGINYKEVLSYPVGFEEEIRLFPLDFEEFLWAKGIPIDVIDLLRECCQELKPVPQPIHEQISKQWREYLVVGGMPDVVQTFVEQDDFAQVVRKQRSIMTTYHADISNYAGRDRQVMGRIFDAIPSELGKQDKRFVLSHMEKGATRRKYEDPTQWLVDAGLAYYSFYTRAFELPLEVTENRSLYKLYLVDTGLLCSSALRNMQLEVMNGAIDINEGMLAENMIACTLAAKGIPLHYYDRKSRQELDFIYPEGDKINIIEVKSGTEYRRHASLDAARKAYADNVGRSIVFSRYNIEQKDGVIYLPMYMSMFM